MSATKLGGSEAIFKPLFPTTGKQTLEKRHLKTIHAFGSHRADRVR